MKRFVSAILLLLWSAASAENLEVQITAEQPLYDGFHFAVAANTIDRAPGSPAIYWVVVAVRPPKSKAAPKDAYVEAWDERDFVFSNVITSCKVGDFPDALRRLADQPETVLFTFKISSACVRGSRFFYQIPRKNELSEPVDCVIQLSEFIKKPNAAAPPSAGPGGSS